MRIWNVTPSLMCDKHLLGEHVELHMLVGSLNRGKNLQGYYDKGLIDTRIVEARHEELVEEMTARGMRHRSPLPWFDDPREGYITSAAGAELRSRCTACRLRYSEP